MGQTSDGWSLMGANMIAVGHRLQRVGWEPTETRKKSLMESLPEEMEVVMGVVTCFDM